MKVITEGQNNYFNPSILQKCRRGKYFCPENVEKQQHNGNSQFKKEWAIILSQFLIDTS